MKCQILFSWENNKNIINLLLAELAQRVVKVKGKDFALWEQTLSLRAAPIFESLVREAASFLQKLSPFAKSVKCMYSP